MDQNNFRRSLVVCLLLGLGTIALYSPALTFSFVNYDDQLYVINNPHVNQGLTADGLGWAFQAGYAANWHPLTWISHMLDVQFFGLRAGEHHATNILLHALNSVLLFLLLRRMTGAFWRSAVAAALFAWHPLHVESVAWVAERKDVLSTFFWMLSVGAWVRYVESAKAERPSFKFYYLAALVFFALGLMSKPMVVTLPCVLLLIDWWPLGRLRLAPVPSGAPKQISVPWQIVNLAIEKVPFFFLSIVSCVLSIVASRRDGTVLSVEQLPLKIRFITAGYSYFRYLTKIFWPTDLGATYPFISKSPDLPITGVVLVLLGISIMAVRARKTRPHLLFGWLWFLGTLFPTLNLAAVGGQPMADRYMYVPSIGLFVLICWEIYDTVAASPRAKIILTGFWGAALAGCCVASSFQLQIWRNDESIVSHIALPEINTMAHANYAAFLMHHNQLAKAETECNKAISIAPGYNELYALLGNILFMEGKYDQAIEMLGRALNVDSSLVDARLPLARALLARQKPGDAVNQFKTVLEVQPANFEAGTGLAEALMAQGKTADGIAAFRQSLNLQPNQPEALNDLAWALATSPQSELRNGAEAVNLAARACELTRHERPIFIGTLAAAYAEAGRWEEAIATAQQAHDLAAAKGLPSVADANLKLQQLYRSHQAFRTRQ